MNIQLRDYQADAVQATLTYFRKYQKPGVMVLPTGAGKSIVIAELARLAKGRLLVLAHVKELVEQNFAKFKWVAGDNANASIFSAGLGEKNSRSKVVFGSVQSVAKHLMEFQEPISLIIVDECHRIGASDESQYQSIIQHCQSINANTKVLGLTATPYRLDTGWIYHLHLPLNCIRAPEDTSPFFYACFYELPMRQLIERGFLTSPQLLDAPVAFYSFSESEENSESGLNSLLSSNERATKAICHQIESLSEQRQGVMIFAATVRHAEEIVGYLPPKNTALVTGAMSLKARDSVINAFKEKQIKFLVNVAVLTTGFDAPHVDVIALLRPTESVALFQQIVGRGLRLCEGKTDCLVLDYANNGYDLFNPKILTPKPDSNSDAVSVPCPQCGFENNFWGKVDEDGHIIEHYGRRCQGLVDSSDNIEGNVVKNADQLEQCTFRFRSKLCPECQAENDIAAKECHACHHWLADPDKRLREALNLKYAKAIRCSGMQLSVDSGDKNSDRLKIIYFDEDGAEMEECFRFETHAQRAAFFHYFVRQHVRNPNAPFAKPPLKPQTPAEACQYSHEFRAPDFVIAHLYTDKGQRVRNGSTLKRSRTHWRITEKLFDYQGQYRVADKR